MYDFLVQLCIPTECNTKLNFKYRTNIIHFICSIFVVIARQPDMGFYTLILRVTVLGCCQATRHRVLHPHIKGDSIGLLPGKQTWGSTPSYQGWQYWVVARQPDMGFYTLISRVTVLGCCQATRHRVLHPHIKGDSIGLLPGNKTWGSTPSYQGWQC